MLALTFEKRGWSVWWDREIPLARSYDERRTGAQRRTLHAGVVERRLGRFGVGAQRGFRSQAARHSGAGVPGGSGRPPWLSAF
jgi:hypothetical protein